MAATSYSLPAARRGDPNLAALLSWFLPGAGQLYLRHTPLALLCFVVVEGLYFAGVALTHGMTFEYLDPELRSLVAPILSPEVGNLGALIYHMKKFGYGTGHLRAWPDHMVLGSMLSAASGVLNGLVMAHAHTLARAPSVRAARDPIVPTLFAWLVPGLGHWLQGRRKRGAIVFVLLVGLFALGTVLADGSNLSRERHFYYWAGQFLLGLPEFVAEGLMGGMRVTRDIPYVEAGLVFGCVAGLLNVIAMLDVYGYGESKALGLPLRASHDASKAKAPPPAEAPVAEVRT